MKPATKKKTKAALALYVGGLLSGMVLSCWLHTPATIEAPAMGEPQQAQADVKSMNKSTDAWLAELESRLDK